MSENPFHPPEAEPHAKTAKVLVEKSILLACALAAIAGVSFTLEFAPPVFIAPAIAFIVMSVRPTNVRTGVQMGAAALLLPFAGYIAFATTCCGTNFGLIENLGHNYSPPPLAGGIVTAVSTLFGCLVIYGLRRIGGRSLR